MAVALRAEVRDINAALADKTVSDHQAAVLTLTRSFYEALASSPFVDGSVKNDVASNVIARFKADIQRIHVLSD